jgi:Lipase (class 3)
MHRQKLRVASAEAVTTGFRLGSSSPCRVTCVIAFRGSTKLDNKLHYRHDHSSKNSAFQQHLLLLETGNSKRCYHHNSTVLSAATQMQGSDDKKPKKERGKSFDIRELWKKHGPSSMDKKTSPSQNNANEFWNKFLSSRSNEETNDKKSGERCNGGGKSERNKIESKGLFSTVLDFFAGNGEVADDTKNKPAPQPDFESIAKNFLKLLTGSSSDKEKPKKSIAEIIAKSRDRVGQRNRQERVSLTEIFYLLHKYEDALGNVANKFVGGIDFSRLTPTALFYYLEHADKVKHPSWKLRMQRFFRGIDVREMVELNDALSLAKLSYARAVDEIRGALDTHPTPYELIYCNVRSEPGKPAHFLAIQRDQPDNTDSLHVILVVRGTKSAADAITGLLCDTQDFQGGKAHSFILGSGRFIADKHRDQLLELCKSAGKSKVELLIIGHSLGAGAASIAGMELNALKDPRISAKVVGFGCPALLCKDLAERSDFITTVINDADVVPRLSGIAVANLLLDVLEFNWLPYAQRDIQSALAELQTRQPMLFNKDVVNKITEVVEPLLASFLNDTIVEGTKERLEVELFPPGKCVHLYRDGVGFSGCHVPNTFCSEIHVSRRMIDGKYHRVCHLVSLRSSHLRISVFADHRLRRGYQQTLLEIERQCCRPSASAWLPANAARNRTATDW